MVSQQEETSGPFTGMAAATAVDEEGLGCPRTATEGAPESPDVLEEEPSVAAASQGPSAGMAAATAMDEEELGPPQLAATEGTCVGMAASTAAGAEESGHPQPAAIEGQTGVAPTALDFEMTLPSPEMVPQLEPEVAAHAGRAPESPDVLEEEPSVTAASQGASVVNEVPFMAGAEAHLDMDIAVEEDVLGELRELRAEAEEERVAQPPEPPPAVPSPEQHERQAQSPTGGQPGGATFQDESRFIVDQNGERLHKWKVDYATRAGAGMAMCRDLECLVRHEQDGVRSIEKGELRIGRRVLMDKGGDASDGHVVIMWYHARCIFNTFLRSRKSTRVIESVDDLEGFNDIRFDDQEMLRRVISGSEDVRAARNRTVGGRATKTPEKRGVPGGGDDPIPGVPTPAHKRMRKDKEEFCLSLKKGDRVWIFCRVRPPAPQNPVEVAREFAVKSPKPELGLIVEEATDESIVVQFESEDHEKERIDKYLSQDKRLAKIKAWFRYPRVFEGKKQKLPVSWIQMKPPPKLCGCVKQSWAHECPCGISCTRGSTKKVWGVGN